MQNLRSGAGEGFYKWSISRGRVSFPFKIWGIDLDNRYVTPFSTQRFVLSLGESVDFKSIEKGCSRPKTSGKPGCSRVTKSLWWLESGWSRVRCTEKAMGELIGAKPLPSAPFPSGNKGISLLESRTQCPDFPKGSSFWNYSLTLYYSAGCLMTDWKQSSKIYFSDLKFSWNL